MPSSSQIRNALAYMAVTVLVLVFLNIYSASASRDLMFKAKCSSAQDKLKVVTSSFSGVDALTQETAEQIISVIGDMNVTRLIVTDASGRALLCPARTQRENSSCKSRSCRRWIVMTSFPASMKTTRSKATLRRRS